MSMSQQILAQQQAIEALRQRVETLLTAFGEEALDTEEIKQRIDNATQDAIDQVMAELEGLDVSDLKQRSELQRKLLGLKNAYAEPRFFFEFFDDLYDAADTIEVGGVETVAGDNSVDISDTSRLVVGREYVLETDASQEVVTIAEILSATRFTATANLGASMTGATLRRTNWSISGGRATAQDGQVYYSLPLSLGGVAGDKAVVVRRQNNDTKLRLFYRQDGGAWTEVPWSWQRDSDKGLTDLGLVGQQDDTGNIDVEYHLPVQGAFSLKLMAEGGQVTVHHIVGLDRATGLGGTHHAPLQPTNDSPAAGATGLPEQPTLALAQYRSPVDSTQAGLQVQVTTTPGDYSSPLHDSGGIAAGLSYKLPEGVLSEGTTYGWRARVQDSEGAWSPWSAETTFETDSTWEFIVAPNNQNPPAGATDIPARPTLRTSAFDTQGFQPIDLNDGSSDLWTQSGATTGEYYYTGSAVTVKPSRVLAAGAELSEGSVGSLATGEWAWADNDSIGSPTIYVKISAGDPDAQTAGHVQAGESHAATQWQIRIEGGDYSSPTWDSGDDTLDLTDKVVPDGVLQDSQTTYYFRARHKGANLGYSEWSAETKFTTKQLFAQPIGLALTSSGGGGGSWQQVDKDGNNTSPTASYFENHPVFGGIKDVVIDGQDMVEIPKFYYKVGAAPSGSDQAGNKVWWISDAPLDGYEPHPAFMDGGSEIDCFYIGKYQAVDDPNASGTKAASLAGNMPLVSIDFPTMQDRCANRNNASGVDGFMLWSIYQRAAIQMLAMIEVAGADSQSLIGQGRVNQSSAANVDATDVAEATYRGIVGLWGNVRQMCDGLQIDGNHVVSVWDRNGNQTFVDTGVTTVQGNDGWQVSMHDETGADYDLRDIFLPKSTDGTENNGTFGDYLWASDSGETNVAYHGGNWSSGSQAGLFDLDCNRTASNSGSGIGGRLAKV